MKASMPLLCVAGLLLLAGCHRRAPDAGAVQNNAAALEASLANEADNLAAQADNAAEQNAAEAIGSTGDNLGDAASANLAAL